MIPANIPQNVQETERQDFRGGGAVIDSASDSATLISGSSHGRVPTTRMQGWGVAEETQTPKMLSNFGIIPWCCMEREVLSSLLPIPQPVTHTGPHMGSMWAAH